MEKKRLYFAAALFNLADKHFNASLSGELQNYFDVALPQRQGFEFSKLHEILEPVVGKEEVENVTNNLIYYLDVGYLLPGCDFCAARLDEPSDPGVDVELMAAREMRMPVIGYRTDCRTPYGSRQNLVRGAHFFPVYNCDLFINFTSKQVADAPEGGKEISDLAKLIYQCSQDIITKNNGLPYKRVDTATGVCYVGKELFHGIEDLHSEQGLKEIVRRYGKLKEAFGNMNPHNMGIVVA